MNNGDRILLHILNKKHNGSIVVICRFGKFDNIVFLSQFFIINHRRVFLDQGKILTGKQEFEQLSPKSKLFSLFWVQFPHILWKHQLRLERSPYTPPWLQSQPLNKTKNYTIILLKTKQISRPNFQIENKRSLKLFITKRS